MKPQIFRDFDFTGFWDDCETSQENYRDEPATDELVKKVEEELGFKLPASYIELMKMHNGGLVFKTCFPTATATSWSADHIAICGFYSIGNKKEYSLCGTLGNQFRIAEGGYPDTGICICDTPSGGHDMVMLDYAHCGNDGEPEVVHVDQELDYQKTVLAKDFETFVRGLVSETEYDTSEQDLADILEKIKTGRFSGTLEAYIKKEPAIPFDLILRKLFTAITVSKTYFALHNDPLSHLAYAIQFYLLTLNKKIRTREAFIQEYPPMVAMGNGDISTGGYANFFADWFDDKVRNREIVKNFFDGFRFSADYRQQFLEQIRQYQ